MFTNTDSIKLIFEDASRSIIDKLASTRLVLEDLSTFNEGQIPEKEFLSDSRRMSNIVDKIELVDGIEKLDLISEYEALLNQFKTRYSDFFNNDVIGKLECLGTKINGIKRLIVAYNHLLQAFSDQDDYKDPVSQTRQLSTGMSLLSEALEQCIAYYYSSSKQLIEIFRDTALAMLRLVASKPDRLHISQESNDHLIALKNTSRSILWQLNHCQKLEKNGKSFQKTTLKDVAGYLKYSGEPKSINELSF